MRSAAYLGISVSCLLALGCPQTETPPPPPPPDPVCGNGLLESGETCEGDPTPAGCDPSTCTVLDGYACEPQPPADGGGGGDGTGTGTGGDEPPEWSSTCMLLDKCFDGVVDMDTMEECDDGNMLEGDGCTNCIVDFGYTCMESPSVCRTCGDGFVDMNLGETCDPGVLLDNPSFGCTDMCQVMDGWSCNGQPSLCGPICGDGIWLEASLPGVTIGIGEQCDDGNTTPGDGCDANCDIEDGCECLGEAPATAMCECGLGTSTGGSTDTDTDTGTGTGTGTTGATGGATTGTGTGTTAGGM